MVGLHIMLAFMSGNDVLLRDAALTTTARLMQADPGVCVQFLKVNLLSNLILSVLLKDATATAEPLVCEVLRAATACPYRETVLQKSQDFKKEKIRL